MKYPKLIFFYNNNGLRNKPLLLFSFADVLFCSSSNSQKCRGYDNNFNVVIININIRLVRIVKHSDRLIASELHHKERHIFKFLAIIWVFFLNTINYYVLFLVDKVLGMNYN